MEKGRGEGATSAGDHDMINGGFLQYLDAKEVGEYKGRAVWKLNSPLYFEARLGNCSIKGYAPSGFETDLGSVPRLPLIWWLWGDRAHRECVWHDYLYRKDAFVIVKYDDGPDVYIPISRKAADWYFKLAMISENAAVNKKGQPWWIYLPMFWGVQYFGKRSFHRMAVMDKFLAA